MSTTFAQFFETGRLVTLSAGQSLFKTQDPVRVMWLVKEGEVDLIRHTVDGTVLLLARAALGQVLAEASAYSESYHCDGIARSEATLATLPVAAFLDHLRRSPQAAELWATRLAQELQGARLQAEIRSLKTVAQRLDAWLGLGNSLPPKGQIQDLARRLGVTREALYRELAKRR